MYILYSYMYIFYAYMYIFYINYFFSARNLILSPWARLIMCSLSCRDYSRMINWCGNRAHLSSLITCKDSPSHLPKLRFRRQFALINWHPTGTIGYISTIRASRYNLDWSLRETSMTQIVSGLNHCDVKLIVSKFTKMQNFFLIIDI